MHNVYGENNIEGCKQVVEYGFTGIEVDVQHHDNQFFLHHDDWSLAKNQTLKQLLDLNLGVDLWVDLKTSSLDSVDRLVYLLSNFKNRVIVEVYKEYMIEPLADSNITVSSTSFDTEYRSVWGLNYVLFGTDKLPVGTWHLDIFCLNDAFLADGGDVVVTDFYEPHTCNWFIPMIVWRCALWCIVIIICIFVILLLLKLICNNTSRRKYYRLVN